MHKVIEYVKTKLETCVVPEFPGTTIYTYAPQAMKYERPFIGIQYKGHTNSTIMRTIGRVPIEHTIDLVIGAKETSPSSSEDWFVSVISKVKDCFRPWVIENDLMPISTTSMVEDDNYSRLKDSATITIRILEI